MPCAHRLLLSRKRGCRRPSDDPCRSDVRPSGSPVLRVPVQLIQRRKRSALRAAHRLRGSSSLGSFARPVVGRCSPERSPGRARSPTARRGVPSRPCFGQRHPGRRGSRAADGLPAVRPRTSRRSMARDLRSHEPRAGHPPHSSEPYVRPHRGTRAPTDGRAAHVVDPTRERRCARVHAHPGA